MFADFFVHNPEGSVSSIFPDWSFRLSTPQPALLNLKLVDQYAESGRGSKLNLGYDYVGGKDFLVTATYDQVMGEIQRASIADQKADRAGPHITLTEGNQSAVKYRGQPASTLKS